MIKRLIRWAFYLFITCVVLLVAGILLLDTIAKEILQKEIRASTGLDAKIGQCSIGLLSPTLTFENCKLYNPPEFGGSPCVDLPELHVEYDRSALWSRKIHLKLLRINLAEVVLVNGQPGKSNFKAVQKNVGPVSVQTGGGIKWQFTGIDTLNLTLNKLCIRTLSAPGKDEEYVFGLKDKVYRNLKTQEDFEAEALLIAVRGGLLNPFGKNNDSPVQAFLSGLKRK